VEACAAVGVYSVYSSEAVGVAVSEARGQCGNPEEGERSLLETLKPLPSNGSEDVTRDTSLCVVVICDV
jgi:hypothetical protein